MPGPVEEPDGAEGSDGERVDDSGDGHAHGHDHAHGHGHPLGHDHVQEHDPAHGHDNDHGHDHDNHLEPVAARVRALESLLVAKGLVDPAAIDRIVDTYEHRVGPRNGARVVARAWTDPAFRDWLERDATAAIASLGFGGRQGEHMRAVFNTPAVHNVVVCTLCSCYPWSVLGLPPAWYKSPAYRSRVVVEPRAVLAEFGLAVPDGVTVHVRDSTSELRWLVVPGRPAGTAGLDEDALAALVTRDAMIGTAVVAPPVATTQAPPTP